VAERGHLDTDLCRKLARNVAAMHERAAPADGVAWIAALKQYIDHNTRAFAEHGRLFDTQAVKELDEISRAALDRFRPLLERRIKLNLVRHGHGDLHLGNLALVDGEPVAFDAIEFDPVIASGDVLYDLAFLLMGLVERGLVGLSNLVLNEYFNAVRRDADLDGIAALPFFMSLRAAIRANVMAARLERDGTQDRAAAEASAQRYFRLACALLQPRQPAVICTAGLSGTGKSVLARSLAPFMPPLPGALILRSDVERKAMTGLQETERLPPKAYSIDASAKLYGLLCEKAGQIARAGHSVIVDAVFARERERTEMENAVRKAGVHFLGLFLNAPLDIRLQRVASRQGDASDADAAVAQQQEIYQLGAMNWTLLDASGSPADTLAKAIELLPDVIKAPARPLPAERRNEDPQAPG
jgi:predicted kinase